MKGEKLQARDLLSFEREKWADGFMHVAGVDEAGRGPLAGPLVAAAVSFPANSKEIPAVDDSKKLSHETRERLFSEITSFPGILYSIAEVAPAEIDRINIFEAVKLAMAKAIEGIAPADFALVDGLKFKGLKIPAQFIVKGDAKSASIAAASILAKVHRDRLMDAFALEYPAYGFDSHKGYGTERHLAALKTHGPCPIHRRSYAPVRDIIDPPNSIQEELGLD